MGARVRIAIIAALLVAGCGGSSEEPRCVEPGDTCNDDLCFNGAADGVCDADLVCQTTPSTTGDCVAFLTSDEHDGDLGGLAGADAICQRRAEAAGLAGTFKAWLSDSSETAASRLTHSAVPYIDTRARLIANDWDDLTDGSLQLPITVDETGFDWDADAFHCGASIIFSRTWTATTITGGSLAPFCNDWTENADGFGTTGFYCYASEAWTDPSLTDDSAGCASSLSLYCLQQ